MSGWRIPAFSTGLQARGSGCQSHDESGGLDGLARCGCDDHDCGRDGLRAGCWLQSAPVLHGITFLP